MSYFPTLTSEPHPAKRVEISHVKCPRRSHAGSKLTPRKALDILHFCRSTAQALLIAGQSISIGNSFEPQE